MIYGVLYDAMLAWYNRQKVRPQYLDFYAVTSLAVMQFGNCLTIIAFLAYLNVGPVHELFQNSAASKSSSIVIAVLLLAVNYAYFRVHSRSRGSKVTAGTRLYWIAPVYMVSSTVAFLYASTLVSTFKR
jgi:cytochrome bd-type quinol oxidase subunit 2